MDMVRCGLRAWVRAAFRVSGFHGVEEERTIPLWMGRKRELAGAEPVVEE